MTYTIKLRRGTASDWSTVNPILAEGELGYELDTRYFKVGDGVTNWNGLEYTVDADQYLPDASLEDDGKILLTFAGSWIITDLPSGLPDATGLPDGKMLATLDEGWIVVDAPAGGGSDPDAMHSSPPLLTYYYDTVEPTSPTDGDIWTDPSDDPPTDTLTEEDILALIPAAPVVPKDCRWFPRSSVTYTLLKEFRDAADLTGAIRVDNSVSNAAAQARMVVTRGGDTLSFLLDGSATTDAAAEMHGYMWAHVLQIGEALEVHILDMGPSYNYSLLGPVVSDGVTFGAGNQVFFPRWSGGASPNPQDGLWTNWNTRNAFTDRGEGGYIYANYMRIWRTASNTWVYQVSGDGITWLTLATRTLTMTPSHVGIAASQWGATGKRVYSIDHLRVSIP